MSKGVLCGVVLLLLCMGACHGASGPLLRLADNSDSAARHVASTRTMMTPSSSASSSLPIPGHAQPPPCPRLECARGFELVVFTVNETFLSPSVSEILSIETGQLIGTATGLCLPIPGTLSNSGSGMSLIDCLFTYDFFERGRVVTSGTVDPSANTFSFNTAVGVDGEFFQALGNVRFFTFPPAGAGAIDTFALCQVKHKHKHHHHKNHDNDNDSDDDDKDDEDEDEDHGN